MKTEILKYLSDRGYNYKMDEADNTIIQFSKNNLNYALLFNEKEDANYLRVILPNIDQYTDDQKGPIRDIILYVMTNYKLVKFLELSDGNNINLWLSVEQLIFSFENINALLDRVINVLETAYNIYGGQKNKH